MAKVTNSLKGRPIKRFFRLLSLERKEIAHIYLYAIFSGLIYLSLPLGIQAIISQVLANELSSSWGLLIFVVTLGTVVVGGLQLMQVSITEMIQQRIFTRASFEFAYRIPRLKMEAITSYYPPELVNRFFDTLNIQKGLPKLLIDFSTASLQIIFGLVLLSFYHTYFIFFGILLILILLLIFRFTGPVGMRTSLEESKHKYQVAYWLEEVARTLRSFKLAGETDLALEKTNEEVSKYLDARKRHFRVLIVQFSNIIAFKTIITAALLLIGSILLIDRQLSIGQFVASEIIIITIINSVEKLVLSMETIYDVLTAVEKLGKVTDLPLEAHEGTNFKNVSTGKGIEVNLKSVSFKLPGQVVKSLDDVSFEIGAGEKVCIAGAGNSGKIMLLNVISGLYHSFEGSMTYNGIPLSNIDPISLRSFIGDCFSQRSLFRGTVVENMTMGSPDVSMDDVRWALDKLNLTDYILAMPDGYQTRLVPEGPQFASVTVKKMILARCIAKRPEMLLMDDMFYMWTTEEKEQVCEFLTCAEMRTVVAITNDKFFASRCDKIIVMEEGTVKYIGTYPEVTSQPFFEELFH